MCLTMARDLGSLGIRVLAIAPSLFATGLTKGIPEEFAKALTKDAAFPCRLGRPEEYAKLVAAIVDNPMQNGPAPRRRPTVCAQVTGIRQISAPRRP
jgi:NAD(P)-dependent dehydrogenase (short-subunit alcohol dehydrogenase family)